ncbi:MAG TPA: hypothetical protein VFJ43_11000 [Bacteroidia bacterium]|nr:hypothetical protein [Bacteroidia bacterium]
MRKSYLLFILPLFIFSCKKDPQTNPLHASFSHFYGTSGDETGRQVRVMSDGDIVVCGYGAGPNGGTDFFLMRTDADGNQRWIKYYGGVGNETCWAFDKTADGGFVIGGYTNSFGAGGDDYYIVKTDADGNVVWTKTYGGLYNDDATNIITVNNGFLISGISNSGHDNNAWILRLNVNGDSIWSFNTGGNGDDGAMSACEYGNGNHAIIGYTNSTSTHSTDGFLVLLNDSGQQIAFYNYGTSGYDEPHGIVPALDGNGWIISGHQGDGSSLSTHNVFVRAIGNNGTELWNKTYGGAAHDGSEAICISGNTYALAGRSNSRPNTGEDVYFLQINADGSLKKQDWLGTNSDDAGYGIAADHGTFILSGYSRGGVYGGEDIYLERIKN